MKHKQLFAISTILIPVIGTTPLFIASSCTKPKSKYKKIDGSDWTGVRPGCYFDTAEFYTDDENFTVTYTSSYFFQGENIVVPNYVKDQGIIYKVLLGENCFQENGGIVGSFECNDFIDSIPDYCFADAWSLETIIMHQYPKNIGDYAFTGTQLSHFYVGQHGQLDTNWTINLISIGDYAFQNLPSLEGRLIFSDKFNSLGEYAFDHCSAINNVDFRFSKDLKTIPTHAFLGCVWIEHLYLPPNIESIGVSAFSGCQLLQQVTLPRDNMVFSLSEGTFYDCISLHNFSRPCTITAIGDTCFQNNTSLTPDFVPWKPGGLTEIPKSAFSQTNYNNLEFYTGYPADIKDGAFNSCSALNRIDFSKYTTITPPEWTGINIFTDVSETGTIILPKGADRQTWMSLFYVGGQPKQGIIIDENHWLLHIAE